MKKFSEEELNEIHEVLHGHVSEQKKADFLKRMASDDDLKEEFEFWKNVEEAGRYNAYKRSAEEALQQVFSEEAGESEKATTIVRPLQTKLLFRMAAGVTVLLAAGLSWWYINKAPADTPLAEEISPPDSTHAHTPAAEQTPVLPNPQKQDLRALLAGNLSRPLEHVPEKFTAAVAKINQKNYEAGIRELKALNAASEADDEPLFGAPAEGNESDKFSQADKAYQNLYLGIGYLYTGNYRLTLETLDKVNVGIVQKEANWYKALTYLGMNNFPAALKAAETVANDNTNPHKDEAIELIKEINNLKF